MQIEKIDITLYAIDLLKEGIPLDTEVKIELSKLGIDYNEFIKEFELKEDA